MIVVYALLGMICWGIAPLFGKLGLYQVHPVTALALRTLIAASLVAGWVAGTKTYTEFFRIPPLFWLFIAIEAILATLVGDLAYFIALKYGSVNNVTLIMSCAPLVTILLSYVFLGETVTFHQLIGAVFITLGLVFICLD